MTNKPIVIAVGGNALIREADKISVQDQSDAVAYSVKCIADLLQAGYSPIVTHGNGPQVGFLLRRAEMAATALPSLPLDILGADTQGATGYLFAKHFREYLVERGIKKEVAAIVTQSVVDENDPAFSNPTKPIGSFMDEETAKKNEQELGWDVREDSGRGWRRVVASPEPKGIVEIEVIRQLVDSGAIVITAGGGGIPVLQRGTKLVGVEAVIDKDMASSLLATTLGVEDFAICTAVEKVYLNFNKDNQKALDKITVEEAQMYLDQGQFGKGSMAPKVDSAIRFIRNGGKRVIITSLESLPAAVEEKAGTIITA